MSVSVPAFIEVDDNEFVSYEEVTGEQLKQALRLALQNNVPGRYYLGVRKITTAFRRAGGTDADLVMHVLRRPTGHGPAANDDARMATLGRLRPASRTRH